MDWLLFSLFSLVFLCLILLFGIVIRLWSQNEKRHTEIMQIESIVRPRSPKGYPIRMKVQPLVREDPKVEVDLLKHLDDEGIL